MFRTLARTMLPRTAREWIRWKIGRPTAQMAPRGELHPNWAVIAAGADGPESDRSVRRSRFIAGFVTALVPSGSTVALLDVGCGWGRLHRRLDELGALDRIRYTGIEHGEDVASAAQEVIPATVVEGSAERLPFPDRSFEIVVAMNVLETLPSFETALEELLRVSSWVVVVASHGSEKGKEEHGHLHNPGVGWYRANLWRPADVHAYALTHGACYAWSMNDITRDDPMLLNVSALLKPQTAY